jgi:hypothetical protein
MEQNNINAIAPTQDELTYQWLDENTRLIGGLKPDQNPEQYSSTLLKMVFEGQKHLARTGVEDPVLYCFLNLLLGEAQVDLALVEKGASTRKMFLTEGSEYCQQAVANLEEQGISGLACRALPRALAILAGAYRSAADDQRPAVETSLKKAADLLDEFKIQQTYERQKAIENLLEGRIFALSTVEMPNPTDRRQVLEKAGASLRRAAGFSGLAFDDELVKQSEEALAAVEKSLSSDNLPAPVLLIPVAASKPMRPVPTPAPAELIGEATQLKAHPWMLDIESGPLKGQRFPLGERLEIGRALENDLVLTDTQVSRKHAVIEWAGQGYRISDLGSGNGTLVNGVLISKPTELKSGDVLQMGETRIKLVGPAEEAGTAPLPLEEPTQRRPAPEATQTHVRAAALPTQVTPAPLGSAATPVKTNPVQQASRICLHCGAPLKPTSKFCPGCGKPVAPEAPRPAAE